MGLLANRQAETASRLVSEAIVTQIVDYASLQSAVTEYLARNQDTTLIARIPTFIQLAEAKFNRQLFVRQMEQRSTALVNLASSEPEFISYAVFCLKKKNDRPSQGGHQSTIPIPSRARNPAS